MKRKTAITIETERLLVIRRPTMAPGAQGAQGARGWCPQCGSRVQMVTPEAAAALTRLSVRAIYRLVEGGEIHFLETADSSLLICRTSLNVHTEKQETTK